MANVKLGGFHQRLWLFVGTVEWAWIWWGAVDSTSRTLPVCSCRLLVSRVWWCYSWLSPCLYCVVWSGSWLRSWPSLWQLGSDSQHFTWRPVLRWRTVHWSHVHRLTARSSEFIIRVLCVSAQTWLWTVPPRPADARCPTTFIWSSTQPRHLDEKFSSEKSAVSNVSEEARLGKSQRNWRWIFYSWC